MILSLQASGGINDRSGAARLCVRAGTSLAKSVGRVYPSGRRPTMTTAVNTLMCRSERWHVDQGESTNPGQVVSSAKPLELPVRRNFLFHVKHF